MASFFHRISYSFGNEDWRTEEKALAIEPGDRVVAVTASGDRPLHCLLGDPREVIAVDANPCQNHVLRLKMAAIRRLDYERYLAFLGARPCKHRQELFAEVRKDLDAEAAAFWLKHQKQVLKGVLYQGAIERWIRRISLLIRLLRRRKVSSLFSFDVIEEQREFVEQQWDTFLWRRLFDLVMNPVFCRLVLRDPGLYDQVHGSISVGAHLNRRMHRCLCRHLVKENSLISLVLRGEVSPEGFPPYLEEAGYRRIRPRLDRITIHTGDLVQYLRSAVPDSIDRFSLSDVASYLPEGRFNEMLAAMIRAARPGARFSSRQFLSRHAVRPAHAARLERETRLEQDLELDDRCFVYRFMVGTVRPAAATGISVYSPAHTDVIA